jgi:hypothetical protein
MREAHEATQVHRAGRKRGGRLAARGAGGSRRLRRALVIRSPQSEAPLLAAVRRGLVEAGFVENQNVAIEFRFSEGRDDQLPSLAADLVGLNVAVFVTTDYPSAVAAR